MTIKGFILPRSSAIYLEIISRDPKARMRQKMIRKDGVVKGDESA
jgi:hypothetical protein